MSRKRIIGIILIAISIVLAIIVYSEIQKTLTLSGLTIGSTASYKPPFEYHGPLVIVTGIIAAVSFLTGLYLISSDRKS